MITAIILTKNSEKTIKKAISSVSFCDEILVIDDKSSDSTKKIVENEGAKVLEKSLNEDFSETRNFAEKKAQNKWILFLDSDEEVSENLKNEIKKVTANDDYVAYEVPRLDVFDKKILKHGETGDVKFIRLGQKGKGTWKRSVHETWKFEGPVGQLQGAILHTPHQTVKEFLEDINIYSTLHAKELKKEGKKASVFTIIAYPTGKFIQNYILKLGFLDGNEGFIVAAMMSFHSFLSQGKLWQLNKKVQV